VLVLRTLARGRADDVVDTKDHLCSLGRGRDNLTLELEGLDDATFAHVGNGAIVHVEAKRGLAVVVRRTEVGHELRAIVATIVGNDRGKLAQGAGKRLDCERLFFNF